MTNKAPTISKADLLKALAHYQQRSTLLAQCLEQANAYRANSWFVLERPNSGSLLVHTDPDGIPSGLTVEPDDYTMRAEMWRVLPDHELILFILAIREYDRGKKEQRTA